MVQTRPRRRAKDAAASKIKEGATNDDDGDHDVDAEEVNDDATSEDDTARSKRGRGKRSKATKDANGSAGKRKRRSRSKASTTAARKPASTQSSPACTPTNDDITNIKTAKGCARQWQSLFTLRDSRRKACTVASPSNTTNNTNIPPSPASDPFDCSDLIIPPAHELINREVKRGIDRWKDLAARVIVEEDGLATSTSNFETLKVVQDEEGEEVTRLRNYELLLDANIRGDKRRQRLLPYNFDYACKRKPSEVSGDDNNGEGGSQKQYRHRPKVISLLDPTQTLDYEDELWNVFNSVRTADELERMYALGSATTKDSGTAGETAAAAAASASTADQNGNDNSPVQHGCKHTLDVKENLKEWMLKYSRMDAHSLGRLRVRDRHSNPPVRARDPVASSASASSQTKSEGDKTAEGIPDGNNLLQTTIRFEVLRHSQNLKRGSGVDGNRMEVELHGSQHTLLDLHRLLVEGHLTTGSRTNENTEDSISAGVFFIENAFYACGNVGDKTTKAIMQWLNDKEDMPFEEEVETDVDPMEENGPTSYQRHCGIGLSEDKKLIPMSDMKLEDLPLRLGVRYFHMLIPPSTPLHLRPNDIWSLANESAVYVTGIHTHSNASTNILRAPIIHDWWAPPQRHICSACNWSLAAVVTVNDSLTDGAPPGLDVEFPPGLDVQPNKVHMQGVAMCSSCYQALHYEPISPQDEDGENSNQSMMQLRQNHKPSLVFPIEEYQRMVTASLLDEVSKRSGFGQ